MTTAKTIICSPQEFGFAFLNAKARMLRHMARRGGARGPAMDRKGSFYNPAGKTARGGIFSVLVQKGQVHENDLPKG